MAAVSLILLGALATGSLALTNQKMIDAENFELRLDEKCKEKPPFKTGDTILLNNKADKKTLIPVPVDDVRTVDQVLRNEYVPLVRKDTRPMYGPEGGGLSISTRAKQNMYRNKARSADVPNLQFLAEKRYTQNDLRRVRERQLLYASRGKRLANKNKKKGGVSDAETYDVKSGGLAAWSTPSGGKYNEFASPQLSDFVDNESRQRTFNSDIPLSATTIFQRNKSNYVTTGLVRETPRVPVTQRGLQEEWMGLGTLDPDPQNARKVLSLSKAVRRSKGASGGAQYPWASLRDKVTSRQELEFETFGGDQRKIIPKHFLKQHAKSKVVGERDQVILRRSKQMEYYRSPNFRIGGRQSAIITTGVIETNRNGGDSAGFMDGKGGEVDDEGGSNTRMPNISKLSKTYNSLQKRAVKNQGEILEYPQRGGHYEGMGRLVAPKKYWNGVSKLDRFGGDNHRFRRPCNQLDFRTYVKAKARDDIAKNRRIWYRQEILNSENKGIGVTQGVGKLSRTQM